MDDRSLDNERMETELLQGNERSMTVRCEMKKVENQDGATKPGQEESQLEKPAPRRVAKKSCSARKYKTIVKETTILKTKFPFNSISASTSRKHSTRPQSRKRPKNKKSSHGSSSRAVTKKSSVLEKRHSNWDHTYSGRVDEARASRAPPSPHAIPKKRLQPKKVARTRRGKENRDPSLLKKKTTVIMNKRERKVGSTSTHLPATVFQKPAFIRSFPTPTEEATRGMETLVDEMRKDLPAFEVLEENMWISFPYRKHLYEKLSNISYVYDLFPALKDWRILKRDFELFKRASFLELEHKLNIEMDLIYSKQQGKFLASPSPLVQKMLKHKESGDQFAIRDLKLICYITNIMGQNFHKFLCRERRKGEPKFKQVTPTIDICQDYGTSEVKITVYCEKRKVVEVPNIYEGILCIYSLYHVFHMCYEKHCQALFESFDTLIGE